MASSNSHREIDTRSKYSDADIKLGLTALAVHSGNSRKAEKALEGRIPHRTLFTWIQRHSDLYEQLRREVVPQIRERAAEQHQALSEYEVGLSRKLSEQLEKSYKELAPRDLPGAIRNLDVGAAVNTDKALTLRGEPTVITEHRSLAENIAALKAKGIEIIDDVPQAKVVDAEVVAEDAPDRELGSSPLESQGTAGTRVPHRPTPIKRTRDA